MCSILSQQKMASQLACSRAQSAGARELRRRRRRRRRQQKVHKFQEFFDSHGSVFQALFYLYYIIDYHRYVQPPPEVPIFMIFWSSTPPQSPCLATKEEALRVTDIFLGGNEKGVLLLQHSFVTACTGWTMAFFVGLFAVQRSSRRSLVHHPVVVMVVWCLTYDY